MKISAILLCVLSISITQSAAADEIARLAASALCRDESGHVRQPPVKPEEPHTKAERVARGMIKTSLPVGGADCYFFLPEAALVASPAPCSPADVGGQDKRVAGTLGNRSCADQ
jgi:hypothetical protein